MRIPSLVVVATLVVWHGLVQGVPHHHADTTVPQERLACSVSHPSSGEAHLHGSGSLLTPHPCLACVAGSNSAVPNRVEAVGEGSAGPGSVAADAYRLRQQPHAALPHFRGPPAGA